MLGLHRLLAMNPSQKASFHSPRARLGFVPGMPPGALHIPADARAPVLHAVAYHGDDFIEKQLQQPEEVVELLEAWPVVWLNVAGVGDADTITRLGQIFKLHPLALEDVVHLHQRAKVDQYDQRLFIVARMAQLNEGLETEQLSMFVGDKFVLTFIEDPGDCFEAVRERLRGGGRLREAGPGYLAYSLLDAVVDSYFPIVESYAERLDRLEDRVIARPSRRAVAEIHSAKHDLRSLRRIVWPLREAVNSLVRDPSPFVDEETRVHLRDCYDHLVQIIDLVETYRELCSDLTDLYLSSLSNRMNEVMKVLTIIATIFMPLGFITGLYGMNFHTDRSRWNMPELSWPYGYPYALGLMALTVLAMLWYFRRKGWLGNGR
ncbi:MAG TPA: magnesium/cobalt transporter CorA [Pirellulales bacterium]|nr:magnesium/cobalt transporter CorA [Pirellulales bacterium]